MYTATYFVKQILAIVYIWSMCPRLIRVYMESVNTLSMFWPYYVCLILVRVSMESMDTLPRGYLCFGHTLYVQCWSEYPWNPQILCQGDIHALAILCMSNVGQSIHGCQKGIHGLGTMSIQWWLEYNIIKWYLSIFQQY